MGSSITIEAVIALVKVLAPLVPGAIVTVEQVIGALRGAGVLTDDQITEEFRQLIVEAGIAKAMADRAASGNDPQDAAPPATNLPVPDPLDR